MEPKHRKFWVEDKYCEKQDCRTDKRKEDSRWHIKIRNESLQVVKKFKLGMIFLPRRKIGQRINLWIQGNKVLAVSGTNTGQRCTTEVQTDSLYQCWHMFQETGPWQSGSGAESKQQNWGSWELYRQKPDDIKYN